MCKLNTPHFILVNRSQYGRGTDFKQDIVEYNGNTCYIRTSVNCFMKYINYLTDNDYAENFLNFFRNEQKRSIKMTSARSQPFRIKHNIKIGCYDGFRVCPRKVTERNMEKYMYENHFRSLWNSNGISFKKAIEELKLIFKVVDNVTSEIFFKLYYY